MSQTLAGQLEKTQVPARKLQEKRRRSMKKLLGNAPLAVIVGLLLVVVIYPLVWLLQSSFKTTVEFATQPTWALPKGFAWQNYVQAWNSGMATYFLNSILAVFPSLLLILAISVSAAFALEVMTWRLRNPVLLLFLAGIMVPLQLVLLPLFTIYFQASLIDTRWALIITYTAFGLPLSVFLMAGFFKSVPREVMEAAVLDGASIYKVFYRVALPMVANGLVTIALVQFFFLWNDLLFTLTFISSDSNRTIQTGLLNFTGQYGQVDWGPTFAAISLAVIPTLILYLVLNQQVIKGLASGSLKG
ncbi:MAG: carbohydrate ABC transporter permease [Chloroflexi bacterium]|nr:MAG: carbohydrate ABC transporter permease [Chloroflexota bacterium]